MFLNLKELKKLNGKRRSEMEISADILKIAMDGAKKSHIVYRANLNFEVVKRYLKHLSDADLIEFPSLHERLFKTTPKGKEYIHQYENLTNYMEMWLKMLIQFKAPTKKILVMAYEESVIRKYKLDKRKLVDLSKWKW